MTQLRKAMLEELQRRNLSPITTRVYLRSVEEFARYYQKSPDQLGPEHIRQYQAHLFTDRKLGATAVAQQLSALRFFFLHTLKRPWMLEGQPSQTPISFTGSSFAGRSGTADSGRPESAASRLAAHFVCDRHAARRVGSSESQRHR